MKCPKCGGQIIAWPWYDGGFKGVQCDACDQKWWSDTIAEAFDEAERAAVRAVIDTRDFPVDAQTDEDHQREAEERIAEIRKEKRLERANVSAEGRNT